MSTTIVRKIEPGSCLPGVEGWQAAFFDCRGKSCPEPPSPGDIYLRARDRHAFASLRTRPHPLPNAVRPLGEAMATRLEASA